MTPEASADDGRNRSDKRLRSDETVRRLREESRQRVERERRWRGFTSWCALATLSSGFALIALDAYEARRQMTEIEDASRKAAKAEERLVDERIQQLRENAAERFKCRYPHSEWAKREAIEREAARVPAGHRRGS